MTPMATSTPDPNAPWPPTAWQPIQTEIERGAAWWSGDEAALVAAAAKPSPPSSKTRGVRDRVRFWARQDTPDTGRQRLHVPLAADIASTSADLLFGEPPQFLIPEAHQKTANPGAKATQDRISELAETDGWVARLLESGEIASGLGGTYLRVAWDPAVADHPMLTVVHPDRAVPEFRWGRLVAVTLWSVARVEGATVWRHLERHEPGVIRHTLHEGTKTRLGPSRPLETLPATAHLDVQPDGTVPLPDELRRSLLVRYVPNMLPNRRHRHTPVGRPDGDAAYGFMDALDETYSSWMRDIRLAKARIIVPDQFLDRHGRSKGAAFDTDREVFSPLSIDPTIDGAGITLAQFEIRSADHAATASALVEQVVSSASYSPATFGLDTAGGGGTTATEIRAREAKSLRTTMRKQSYYAVTADLLELLLVADRAIFRSGVEPFRPRIQFSDGLPDDPQATAQTITMLAQAEAVSIETRVRMAQPDLDEGEVAAEVERIRADQGTVVADPTGGFPETRGDDGGERDVKTKADALGILIRAGVDPADAAHRVGLDDVEFTGAVPVSLRLPEHDATKVEER